MITLFFAGLLSLIFFAISIDTIKARRKHQISLGYGPHNEIEQIVSAHANFVAYVPLFLILNYGIESSKVIPTSLQITLLTVFFLGRLFHYLAFRGSKMNFPFRIWGMHMTLWPLLLSSCASVLIPLWLYSSMSSLISF